MVKNAYNKNVRKSQYPKVEKFSVVPHYDNAAVKLGGVSMINSLYTTPD